MLVKMAEEKTESTVTIKKSTLTFVVVAIVFLAVGFGAGWVVKPTANVAAGGTLPTNNGNAGTGQPVRFTVDAGDAPFVGSENAPVTIIEFSDYECPFCSRFYTETEIQIRNDYVDTGKVKLVYKDFPLSSLHPSAQKAAEAARCAGDQGKYWEMHDILFEKQQEWASLGVSKTAEYAATLGLDGGQFSSCLSTGKYTSAVQKDFNEGSSLGVSGTPTFFVNGLEVVGAQPYAIFKQIIDQELAA